jgi:signal transduction histidine kinase/HAMP domain-containing protein
MRLSIRAKQVAGVTLIVALAMVVVNALYLARIARISLEESQSRGELLARTVYQAVTESARPEALEASLQESRTIRVLAEAGMAYTENVTYVVITDPAGRALVHSSPTLEGEVVPPAEQLSSVIAAGAVSHFRAIYSDRTFEVRETLLSEEPGGQRREFGSIRVGLSMLLVRANLREAMEPTLLTLLGVVLVSLAVATSFARWLLRPITVLRSGLTRLERGEFGVKLDLPGSDEFADLGKSFNTLSAELSAARTTQEDHPARLESVVDRLEDAVAIVSATGDVLFANRGMRELLGDAEEGVLLPATHPLHGPLQRALQKRQSEGPVSLSLPGVADRPSDFLVTVHPISDRRGRFIGAMLMARNVAYLAQVQSTIRYSRKVTALGRLLAGVAHEVKNPLNAMTIHLELLTQKLGGNAGRRSLADSAPESPGTSSAEAGRVDVPGVMKHAGVISDEITRLDNVVQGFLKFTRPEELVLAAVDLRAVCDDVSRVIEPEAHAGGVQVRSTCAADVPHVYADRDMLRQAILNLALNAVQAMPGGGTLAFASRRAAGRMVELTVSDTGAGIAPQHLARIFDLYFTTKDGGSGIGLSMVYRTVHLHDGSIEVESTPGHGTTFRLVLPQA